MNKKFLIAMSVLVGTCVGAGFLGIPYVASRAGFLAGIFYILVLGFLMILVNLYVGEISLRTKEKHQISGYAAKYLGRKGKIFTEFAILFGLFSALVAYLFGVGESLSYLFFGNENYVLLFGGLFGLLMSRLIWRGMRSLKKFEKFSVSIVLILMIGIFVFLFNKIDTSNLVYFNPGNFLLPFGVVLFSMLCFSAIPEINLVLGENKKAMKKILISGGIVIIVAYSLFSFAIVGFKGTGTPEVATLALGKGFVVLGILSMFGAYLALGNALEQTFVYDKRLSKRTSWFLSSIIPLFLFLVIKSFNVLSFTKILSIGGVVSGGLTGIFILLMVKKAKKIGKRKPEYSIPVNWFIIIGVSLIFILGIVRELFVALK